MSFTVAVEGNGSLESDSPVDGIGVLKTLPFPEPHKVVAWRVNNFLRSLAWKVDTSASVSFVDTSSFEGSDVYRRTLSFLLVLACRKALDEDVVIRHSISNALYCELAGRSATETDVERVRDFLHHFVEMDIPIVPEIHTLDRAVDLFQRQGNEDKARLLKWAGHDPLVLYRCADRYAYFYAPLAPSTGYVKTFDVMFHDPGMVLRCPSVVSPDELPPFQAPRSLVDVFREYGEWLDILGVSTMANLHEQVAAGKGLDLILISEALHAQRLNRIAEEIVARGTVRVIPMAGPSGSGKTTTSRRLRTQLQVAGLHPVTLELDDYFVDRERTPRDSQGNYDFEALEALDLERLDEDLHALLAGREVRLPKFDFRAGKSHPGRSLRLKERDVLIMEGIHGLNQRVVGSLPPGTAFGVFVSPLTGVSLDRHNRTSTTDNRLLRRMVRDSRTRGRSPEVTLQQWPSVIRGAQKYIFPYQEHADAMFNTALIYELSVLKGHAEPLLRTVPETSPVFGEAQRLLSMLHFVPFIPEGNVPNASILREFIGGSCFGD
ncbi:nucleoside kinase [Aminiphilus circumscriptus]|uniref:nucleoside kinase n=1 Tax=Aminiphilus circumscriptus TaxID=290732 RepID=UPI00047857E7|nr:nucleoside kinase [Aminiphilus circumscriptus]